MAGEDSVIPVGSVGLAVSQSMVLTMMLQMAARFTADFLAHMTSVERVLEYEKLPSEVNIENGREYPAKYSHVKKINYHNIFIFN